MYLRLESEKQATREPEGFALVRGGQAALARLADDAANGGARRDDVADRADEVQHARLRDDVAEGARAHSGVDEGGEAKQHGRDGQLRRPRDARLVVEQLAEQELHAAWVRVRPGHQPAHHGVEAIGPRAMLVAERARHHSVELLTDDAEHVAVELLLLGEVVDDRRER